MPRYAALVQYDGSPFQGFQRQKQGVPTVQGELERALFNISKSQISVTGAGRTDSGVHATGQVIGFNLDWSHSCEALQRATNANLPDSIAILQLKQVTASFHPRYDARRRGYIYQILNSSVRHPVERLRVWHVAKPLNCDAMNDAAQFIKGEHDFATFGRPPSGTNSVRFVHKVQCWRRMNRVFVFIEANAFLFRMVRSIVGSLKMVGDGTWTNDEFKRVLEAQDRSKSAQTAPPHGLYLVSVTYENEELKHWGLHTQEELMQFPFA